MIISKHVISSKLCHLGKTLPSAPSPRMASIHRLKRKGVPGSPLSIGTPLGAPLRQCHELPHRDFCSGYGHKLHNPQWLQRKVIHSIFVFCFVFCYQVYCNHTGLLHRSVVTYLLLLVTYVCCQVCLQQNSLGWVSIQS